MDTPLMTVSICNYSFYWILQAGEAQGVNGSEHHLTSKRSPFEPSSSRSEPDVRIWSRFNMDGSQRVDQDGSASADLQFGYLAVSLAQLLETAKRELEHDREAAKASLVTASSILQSEIERRSRAKASKSSALAGWQTARVRAFIETNLHRTIHTRDISAVARRSRAHFARSFKQAFGEPPHAYVVRRRLEKACHLMITSAASLSEIALSVGFSDQAHLCKLFKQAFGQSPSSWRRERETPLPSDSAKAKDEKHPDKRSA